MSRTSIDEFNAAGIVKNGFDYSLQVWVKDYIIQACGHPALMGHCCNGKKYAGQDIRNIEGHEAR